MTVNNSLTSVNAKLNPELRLSLLEEHRTEINLQLGQPGCDLLAAMNSIEGSHLGRMIEDIFSHPDASYLVDELWGY